MNTVSLVEKAIALKQEAEKNGVRCAYSIESFELWDLLHFSYCDAKLSRDEYCEKLTAHLKTYYRKNDPDIYKKLHGRMKTAIKNASTLYVRQSTKKLSDQNPITLVFQHYPKT